MRMTGRPSAPRSACSWLHGVARRADDLSEDPVLVVSVRQGEGAFDERLLLVVADGPGALDVGAAEILRKMREHGER